MSIFCSNWSTEDSVFVCIGRASAWILYLSTSFSSATILISLESAISLISRADCRVSSSRTFRFCISKCNSSRTPRTLVRSRSIRCIWLFASSIAILCSAIISSLNFVRSATSAVFSSCSLSDEDSSRAISEDKCSICACRSLYGSDCSMSSRTGLAIYTS